VKVNVVVLDEADRAEAVAVLAAAFASDPVWVAIAPRRARARARMLDRYFAVAVDLALRSGGPNWCARHDGSVIGVALAVGEDRSFPLPGATWREAPPFLLAGPGPALRAVRVDTVMKRLHPAYPHLYLWFLGVHPDVQRRGAGRALLGEVIAEAGGRGVPVCLDTSSAENVAYYRSAGFRDTDVRSLPRATRMWAMARDLDG
jgi:ribosomal protein S18 acetylase RimI-like enzyme